MMHPAFLPSAPLPSRSSPRLRSSLCARPIRSRLPTRPSLRMVVSEPSQQTQLKPLIPILMGSASDLSYCQKIASALSALGLESELRIASAHKIPARLLSVIDKYELCPRPKVYIAVAGRSNALSGMLDCAVAAPVISCPPPSDKFGGADLFSSIRMPSGVCPALVLEPGQAALLAAKSLGVYDHQVRETVKKLQKANRDRLYVDDAQLTTETYRPAIEQVRETGSVVTETNESMVFGSSGVSVGEVRTGKVRDQYEFKKESNELLALVTTDRQSAFDRHIAAIPYKGAVLNLTSAWWFHHTSDIVPNHIVATPHANVTIAKRCTPFPVEFVVRGYITGSTDTSLWKNYSKGVRNYCGIDFPDGLKKNQKLECNVLTPTTKEVAGDRPISPVDVVKEGWMTQEDWDYCADKAMKLFSFGQSIAAQHGLILVDTKYEFGKDSDGTIRLIDEIHTPDSSRYWLATSYQKRTSEGKEPENVDKELLRLWFRDNSEPYNKEVPLPEAPADLVDELSRRYIMLYELITGEAFDFDGAIIGEETLGDSVKRWVQETGSS